MKSLGKSDSKERTRDQTDAARFWGTVNAAGTLTMLVRTLAELRPMSLVDRARFYALIYLNTADTGIATWRDKAKWSFWRPVTAINLGDADGNPQTEGDPTWASLIPAPPYPDHSSGLAAAGGSIVATAQELFGTDHVRLAGRSRRRRHRCRLAVPADHAELQPALTAGRLDRRRARVVRGPLPHR